MSDNHLPILWLTGNTGAGKSTLAFAAQRHFNEKSDSNLRIIVLDGDEMRATISESEDLSPEGRRSHNLRVARLAKLLADQGLLVLVSVIAPFQSVREEIQEICDPQWIYVKRSGLDAQDKPYEPPQNAALVIDTDVVSKEEGEAQIIEFIEKL